MITYIKLYVYKYIRENSIYAVGWQGGRVAGWPGGQMARWLGARWPGGRVAGWLGTILPNLSVWIQFRRLPVGSNCKVIFASPLMAHCSVNPCLRMVGFDLQSSANIFLEVLLIVGNIMHKC